MKRKAKVKLSVVFGCILSGIVLVVGGILVADDAQYPKSSFKLCITPPEDPMVVTSCGTIGNSGTCETYRQVIIKDNFPDGTSPGGTHFTKQVQSDCWYNAYCYWDTSVNPKGVCKARTFQNPIWTPAAEIVDGGEIPGEQ